MKKYIITVSILLVLLLGIDFAYYHLGWYLPVGETRPEVFVKTDGEDLLLEEDGAFTEYEMRGVNLGSSLPGKWGSEYAIEEETYLRWFEQIQEMGANTIRVFSVQSDVFYSAFYHYNKQASAPLYLLQGVAINDYVQFSHRDAFDKDYMGSFLDIAKTAVDVIHGRKKIQLGREAVSGSGSYRKDVSDWVVGYLLGSNFDPSTVAYTNEKYKDSKEAYHGRYLYAEEGAAPFEIMLATVGDKVIEYETKKYGEQRLIAFANFPETDPFSYPEEIAELYMKYAEIDVEKIAGTEAFLSGQFAAYQVYPFQTDLLLQIDDFRVFGLENLRIFHNADGSMNDYGTYLGMLNSYHSMPVVVAEFGVTSGRNTEHETIDSHGRYSKVSEREQGEALRGCWEDIKQADLNGGCIYSWHDEWEKRSMNTLYAIQEQRSPYWSDYQTNGQYFGLLSFDPGKEQSVCYVDGDASEWLDSDVVASGDGMELSVRYDEKFMYFLVRKENLDFSKDLICIPIDTTPKTGSNYCKNQAVGFDRDVDFLLILNGGENSRLLVQERYEALRSTYSRRINGVDTYREENIPEKNSPAFVPIRTIVEKKVLSDNPLERNVDILVETGKLLYGNANPESAEFDSLADFCANGDCIEIKLPWQLMNFADPSKMLVHDDYYDGNYGIEYLKIDRMYAGISGLNERIELEPIELEGWGNRVTYHERLKSSYDTMQELWKGA